MLADKFRFRFSKTGTLRLLSHHDLMRCLERMLRRADLPFKSTAGFHPGPRVVFALSLPLGVEGLDEVVEIEFTRAFEADEVLARLRAQTPPGLAFTRVSAVPMKATARPRRAVYRLALPAERVLDATVQISALLAREKVWVDRLKPSPKRLNIRPYLRNIALERAGEADWLALDFWVTQTGTVRVNEVLELLGLGDLLDSGVVVERTTVELHDETTNPDPADEPPSGPAETLPLDPDAIAALARREEDQAAAVRSVSPAGPVVE
jgi:radical SAM-linked protein